MFARKPVCSLCHNQLRQQPTIPIRDSSSPLIHLVFGITHSRPITLVGGLCRQVKKCRTRKILSLLPQPRAPVSRFASGFYRCQPTMTRRLACLRIGDEKDLNLQLGYSPTVLPLNYHHHKRLFGCHPIGLTVSCRFPPPITEPLHAPNVVLLRQGFAPCIRIFQAVPPMH